ncbi:MAG: hypothetical protein AB1512_28260 [Thermodesulfobacteriota bacterium]
MLAPRLSPEAPIQEKIAWARTWWAKKGGQVLAAQETARLGKLLKTAVERSRRAMAESGILEACGDCERNGGSCCGVGLERHYTDLLLLINLMLGVDLPMDRLDSKSCLFLGAEGCRLMARHVICINYLCRGVTSRIDPSRIAALRGHEGKEIALLFRLNEQFHKILSSRHPGGYNGTALPL